MFSASAGTMWLAVWPKNGPVPERDVNGYQETNMQPIRFIMLGGFLGAGKTTAIARLARHFTDAGQRVGLVTNDQAFDLVDTHALRSQGFRVGEVPGACFCCKFDDLIATVAELSRDEQPDVILAEPVGSCTDLVATVVEPLEHLYGDDYRIAPFVVLLKPEHGRKILGGGQQGGFSPKAEYIFLKQIEEADVIVVNKTDKLSASERDELIELVQKRFPEKRVLHASGKTGIGFDAIIELVSTASRVRQATPDIDYEIYAQGEAELGWVNCTFELSVGDEPSPQPKRSPLTLDGLLVEFVSRVQAALADSGAEIAHFKVLAQSGDETAIANLVDSEADVELSRASGAAFTTATVIVNARVATSPQRLSDVVRDQMVSLASEHGFRAEVARLQSFRPSPPVPTHRMPVGSSSRSSGISE